MPINISKLPASSAPNLGYMRPKENPPSSSLNFLSSWGPQVPRSPASCSSLPFSFMLRLFYVWNSGFLVVLRGMYRVKSVFILCSQKWKSSLLPFLYYFLGLLRMWYYVFGKVLNSTKWMGEDSPFNSCLLEWPYESSTADRHCHQYLYILFRRVCVFLLLYLVVTPI